MGQIGGVYEQQRVNERAAIPYITPTVKNRGGSVKVCKLQSWIFAPGERQIESNQLSQHTAASHDPIWNMACGSRICLHARLLSMHVISPDTLDKRKCYLMTGSKQTTILV